MITIDDYLGPWRVHPDVTETVRLKAGLMLQMVNLLLLSFGKCETNPKTKTLISGTQYGGFRPQNCPQGSKNSSHKTGEGVDIYDPADRLDAWLTDETLEQYGLYREDPMHTKGWTHLTVRPPPSGKRSFIP